MVTEKESSVTRAETDILDPTPVKMKVGRNEEYDIEIRELVLRQYNKIFKIFSKILIKFFETNMQEFTIGDLKVSSTWRQWLPELIGDAGDEVNELLMIALEVEKEVVENITGKQLPNVLTSIIEVNGLEQIIVGFRRLSVTIVTEIAKRKQKD